LISPRLKNNIHRVIPFGIIWLLFGIIFLVVEYAATNRYEYKVDGVIAPNFLILVFALTAVTMVGLIIGIIELLFINKIFEKANFVTTFLGKLIIYSFSLFFLICLLYPIAASIELGINVSDNLVWEKFTEYLDSIAFLSTGFQMGVSLVFTLFYNEIHHKIGSKTFTNFLTGKYHQPKVERRIFMFLDMNSSTATAEKLGHLKYFELLKLYYNVLSEAVIDHSGEIYQYVGDEMVVSWELSAGLKNNNCIKCFFKMKQDLKAKQDVFNKKYSITPTFKAGLHVGEVAIGEIGKFKKDIIFTGDTLNATARIQALCNKLKVDHLISADLISLLKTTPRLQFKSLGHHELRGKEIDAELFTL
jgi:adenylate cyclase